MKYIKVDLMFPDGCTCPSCGSKHFHPKATILVDLKVMTSDGKANWVARSECIGKKCNGYIDWSFDPDATPGTDLSNRRLVNYKKNPLMLQAYNDFPRSKDF
jgi:hypothetical protein